MKKDCNCYQDPSMQYMVDAEEQKKKRLKDNEKFIKDATKVVDGINKAKTPKLESLNEDDDLMDNMPDDLVQDFEDEEQEDEIEDEEALGDEEQEDEFDDEEIEDEESEEPYEDDEEDFESDDVDIDALDSFKDYEPWGDAESVWETIVSEGKEEALESLLDELYPEGIDEQQLNDILAYSSDWVLEQLGL